MPGLVLLVEDEAPLRELLVRVLERYGYQVVAASTAAEAMGLLSEASAAFSAAIVDLTLPDDTGDAVLNAARATRPDLFLLATSGTAFAGDRYPMREGEAAYCLSKPFLPRVLFELLAEHSGQSPASSDA